jgi:all-trans-nonaprenyl-diphosphate synthase
LFYENIPEANIKIAEISEIIHTATLLHDDVIDNSCMRRGKETVNAIHGNRVSVLCGDYLLSKASQLLASLKNIEIVEIFSRVLEDICLGELQQTSLLFDTSIDMDTYILKSQRKTAILFSSAMEAAAIISEANESEVQALKDYGLYYGLAFQIVDDILNFATEQQVGKSVCDDLKNGILTAPVIYAMNMDPDLEALINTHFEDNNDFEKAVDIIVNSGSIYQTKQLANTYVQKAIDSLKVFNSNNVTN